jgi:catechol 2,3-dioxygenase-like lactoylglutathione lyase family enzyme
VPSTAAPRVEARRFLHCCYCCRDADNALRGFCDGLGLELVMRSAGARLDGSQLGFAGEVETDACFVYDARGPRVSPAIEVQAWLDPPTAGEPYPSGDHVGFQALGVAVGSLDQACERLGSMGYRVIGRAADQSPISARTVTLLDPTGVSIDLVEEPDVAESTRLVHLRATCSDLDRSIEWYRMLGFEVVSLTRRARVDGTPFGVSAAAEASVARLRLPDEPFALLLVEWHDPPSHGESYPLANHAGLYRFAVAVDDTRAAFDTFKAAGMPVSDPPAVVPLPGTKVPDMWIAFLTDPDGLTVELVERPRSAFR